jgi:hypothetical protein
MGQLNAARRWGAYVRACEEVTQFSVGCRYESAEIRISCLATICRLLFSQ